MNTKNASVDMVKQAEILSNLYQLLCDACRYEYFSSDDPFNSVGITQTDFYRSVLQLIDKAQGKAGVVNRGIGLIVNNDLSTETLYSFLMVKKVQSTLNICRKPRIPKTSKGG